MVEDKEVELLEIDPEALKEVARHFAFTIAVTPFIVSDQESEEVKELGIIVTFAGVEVEIPLEEFSLEAIPEELYQLEIGGILDPLGQLIQWLWSMIEAALEELRRMLEGFIRTTIDGLKSWIISVYGTLEDIIRKIADAVAGAIKGLHDWFVETIVKPLESFMVGVRDYLLERFQGLIADVRKWWDDFVTGFRAWFEKTWRGVYTFFKDAYDGLAKGLNLVSTTLGGFINATLKIHEWLIGFPGIIVGLFYEFGAFLASLAEMAYVWVKDVGVPTILDFAAFLWDSLVGGVRAIISAIYDGLVGIARFLISTLMIPAVAGLIEFAKPLAIPVAPPVPVPGSPVKLRMEYSSELYPLILDTVIIPVINTMTSQLQGIFGAIVEYATVPGIPSFFSSMGLFFATVISGQALGRGLWAIFHLLGDAFRGIRIDFSQAAKIFGSGIELSFRPYLDVGAMFHHIAAEFKEYGDILGRALVYGLAIWISRPIAMLMNAALREIVPIEVPPAPAMIEESRRMIPHGAQPFPPPQYIDFLSRQLAFRGFPGKFAEWYTRKYDVLPVIILDRFGKQRVLPTGLMYDIPTASEMARMMVRDIFGPPEVPLQSFLPAMEMRGFHPHTAVFYYLLHFRYPGMERLFQFLCRVAAGLAWADIAAVPEAVTYKGIDLTVGATGPTPRAMATGMYPATLDVSIAKLRELVNVAKLYAKWMDYARFAWIPGFASDSAIMFDTMADIPLRIDARWMYKWMLIGDLELSKIVLARGMHPDWVKRISVAEAMNALMEERTLARGGVMRAFRDGFTTTQLLTQTLANLTTVTILEEPYIVRFLPGEVSLLTLRAKYDRAYDILKDYSKTLIRSVAEHIRGWNEVMTHLAGLTSQVATTLGIRMTLDTAYFQLYRPTVEVMYDILTIRRIRILIRWMMYRIMYRFSDGFMTWQEIEELINTLTKHGRLTKEERALIYDMARYMYDYYARKSKARAILRRLGRGVISEAQAVRELMALGLEEPIAKALVEEHSKIYTLSVAALLSYATIIHIPEELIKRKLDFMGVPEDEKPIILQVFRIRPIRDELARVARSILNSYEDAYIDKRTAEEQLKQVFKRPEEIRLLLLAADIEKAAKKARERVRVIIDMLKQGRKTVDEARRELREIILDRELVEYIIERYRPVSFTTPTRIISMMERIPVPDEWLKKALEREGFPREEITLWKSDALVAEIEEEIKRIQRVLHKACVKGVITLNEYRNALNQLATFWGRAPAVFGVQWIIFSPLERQIFLELARREIELKKSIGEVA